MKLLGIDIGGTAIKVGLANEHGEISLFKEYASESKKGGEYMIQKVMRIITEMNTVDAIGISTAGQVNHQDGSILYANDNIPGYTGMPLKELLEDRFGVPVMVENDVNAAAMGEYYFGNTHRRDDFLFLTYGTGIGGALFLNGRLYHGNDGIAGEFGHLITHPSGALCNCGRYGCYEAYASTTALINKAKLVDKSYDNGRIIFEGYQQGDVSLQQLIVDWIYEVALGLTSLIHIFNPPSIIIGGGIMEQDVLVKQVSFQVKQMIMDSFSNVQIQKASLGNKAGVLGAIALHLAREVRRSML
ncbi:MULTISPECIES: ROK family protein [unclassified Virgibacillus]|uniref:ROK family protein n=1 Tax=unclassified Virgibacillus TaxID=2620237 RepID=UPI0024DE6E7A|nr:ROK family protein [Virgibacillus sp. LDC-1]